MDGIISDQLSPIELNIEQIYLDPNNPRFVDDNWIDRFSTNESIKPMYNATLKKR